MDKSVYQDTLVNGFHKVAEVSRFAVGTVGHALGDWGKSAYNSGKDWVVDHKTQIQKGAAVVVFASSVGAASWFSGAKVNYGGNDYDKEVARSGRGYADDMEIVHKAMTAAGAGGIAGFALAGALMGYEGPERKRKPVKAADFHGPQL